MDVGMIEGVGAGKNDLTLTMGLYGVGEDDHGLGAGGEARISVIEVQVWVDPETALPDISVITTREESKLGVVGVVVTKTGRKPSARLVQRRRHQAVAGRGPLCQAPHGLSPEPLELL